MTEMLVGLGADPEFFILSPQGESVPAHTFFTRQKDAPFFWKAGNAIWPVAPGGKMFRDGWALEINPRFKWCRAYVYEDVKALLKGAMKMLPLGYTLSSQATVHLKEGAMDGAPEDVLTTGCSPSWDAYTGETKVPEVDYTTYHKRHSGGHIHFSMGAKDEKEKKQNPFLNEDDVKAFIKLCDLYVGLPSTVLFACEGLWERREVYGQAGEFRRQQYPNGAVGCEYRTPSAEIFNHP